MIIKKSYNNKYLMRLPCFIVNPFFHSLRKNIHTFDTYMTRVFQLFVLNSLDILPTIVPCAI